MKNTISPLDPTYPIIEPRTGNLLDHFRLFLLQVQNNGLLIGSGSPEGVIEAQQGREYLDETGGAGAVKYIKQSSDIGGDRTLGWVAI